MNLETNRLNTFTHWPSSAPVDPIRIAKAGFFYTGLDLEVQCFSCGLKITEWNYGDQVMWKHRAMEPNCTFVVNPMLSGNVPLVLGRECSSYRTLEPAQNMSNMEEEQQDSLELSQDYGLADEDDIYKSDALRILSFSNWEDTSVSREELVSAGFYHAGGGRLRCAWCGGELSPFCDFGTLGSPLDVHRMYFPRCAHAAAIERYRRSNSRSSPSPSQYTHPLETSLIVQESNEEEAREQRGNQLQSEVAAHNSNVLADGAGRSLGVIAGEAKHPTKASLAARLATFHCWPADRAQSPEALADAGFFYIGVGDQVHCFFCDGGLGKWEANDSPWTEHARWFPQCGYVLLVKGQEFVEMSKRHKRSVPRTVSAGSRLKPNVNNVNNVQSQVDRFMESDIVASALNAGLDAARVRRAIVRRLRTNGTLFSTAEALIDAVLNEQLNEVAWSASPQNQRLVRDIFSLTSSPGLYVSSHGHDSADSVSSVSDSSPSPVRSERRSIQVPSERERSISRDRKVPERDSDIDVRTHTSPIKRPVTLEEENRQLKEARLCKVCMDNEVSVVFLPCGHMVSCAKCGSALATCPLCRASVRALVRAYLA